MLRYLCAMLKVPSHEFFYFGIRFYTQKIVKIYLIQKKIKKKTFKDSSANLHRKTTAFATFAATLAFFADLIAILCRYFSGTFPILTRYVVYTLRY